MLPLVAADRRGPLWKKRDRELHVDFKCEDNAATVNLAQIVNSSRLYSHRVVFM